jgi:hypothetical protein
MLRAAKERCGLRTTRLRRDDDLLDVLQRGKGGRMVRISNQRARKLGKLRIEALYPWFRGQTVDAFRADLKIAEYTGELKRAKSDLIVATYGESARLFPANIQELEARIEELPLLIEQRQNDIIAMIEEHEGAKAEGVVLNWPE